MLSGELRPRQTTRASEPTSRRGCHIGAVGRGGLHKQTHHCSPIRQSARTLRTGSPWEDMGARTIAPRTVTATDRSTKPKRTSYPGIAVSSQLDQVAVSV